MSKPESKFSSNDPVPAKAIWDQQVCPHCQSNAWVRVPRSLLQKLFHANEVLCFCRQCRQKFWRPSDL